MKRLTERMVTSSKRDNLTINTIEMHTPELARAKDLAVNGKGDAKGKTTNNNSNKGKGKGKGKNVVTTFAQL